LKGMKSPTTTKKPSMFSKTKRNLVEKEKAK
jgi:hypothetical protein